MIDNNNEQELWQHFVWAVPLPSPPLPLEVGTLDVGPFESS